jgi:hypothetical protein
MVTCVIYREALIGGYIVEDINVKKIMEELYEHDGFKIEFCDSGCFHVFETKDFNEVDIKSLNGRKIVKARIQSYLNKRKSFLMIEVEKENKENKED